MSLTELELQARAAESAPARAIEGRSQWRLTWERLHGDKVAVASAAVIVVMLALAVVLGPSLPVVIGVISFFAWSGIARVVRGQTLSIKEKEYIEAARSVGAGPWRIMFVDIMPNLLGPVLVLVTLAIPSAIVF